MVSYGIAVVIAVVVGVVAAAIAFFCGISYRRKVAEQKLGSAEEEAKRIINDAIKTAEQKRREAAIEAKDEVFKLKAEAAARSPVRRGGSTRKRRTSTARQPLLSRKKKNRKSGRNWWRPDWPKSTRCVSARLKSWSTSQG